MGEDGKEGGTVGSGSLSRRQPIKFQRINVDFRAVYRSDCLFFAFQTLVGHAKRHGYVDLTTNSITPRSFGTFNSEGCTIDSSHVLETLLLRNTTIIADLEQPVLLIFFFPFFRSLLVEYRFDFSGKTLQLFLRSRLWRM